jgi:tRNA threonylcarbamoyladenosine biosynthesis protein TsaB
MANILLIETATEVCGAAIAVDGQIVALQEELDTQSHATLLTLQIQQCVQESGIPLRDLDAIAVSRGPGSYTALRVGSSVAKGICYALDKPLITVDTLQALAWASRASWPHLTQATFFAPMIDARRQEIWMALYDAQLREVVPAQPFVLEDDLFHKILPAKIWEQDGFSIILSGNGSLKAGSYFLAEETADGGVEKSSVGYLSHIAFEYIKIGEFQDVAYYEPFYMKPPNITIPNKVL